MQEFMIMCTHDATDIAAFMLWARVGAHVYAHRIYAVYCALCAVTSAERNGKALYVL